MDEGYRFGSWFVDGYGWSRMSLPFALLAPCSLPILSTVNNLSLILLYTLLPVYTIHQYEEHAQLVRIGNWEVQRNPTLNL